MKKMHFSLFSAILLIALCNTVASASSTTNDEAGINIVNFTTDGQLNAESATALSADDPIKKKQKGKKRRNSWMPVRLFEAGQWDANLSFGTVPTYLMDNAKILMPPIQAGMNYRITEHFSIGATVGHSISESQPRTLIKTPDGSINADWTNNTTFIAIRPGVHIVKLENWDFYGGFAVGVNFINIDGNSPMSEERLLEMESHFGIERHQTNATFSGFTGFRRVISPRWTVGGEVGSGISLFTVGASYKISKSKTDPS